MAIFIQKSPSARHSIFLSTHRWLKNNNHILTPYILSNITTVSGWNCGFTCDAMEEMYKLTYQYDTLFVPPGLHASERKKALNNTTKLYWIIWTKTIRSIVQKERMPHSSAWHSIFCHAQKQTSDWWHSDTSDWWHGHTSPMFITWLVTSESSSPGPAVFRLVFSGHQPHHATVISREDEASPHSYFLIPLAIEILLS
jgi:hypothetical protein